MSDKEEILSVEQNNDHAIVMGEALIRLRKNQDFKDLIEEGYLKDKVLASVSLLSVPQIKDQNRRSDVMEDLISASNLQYFLQMVENAHIDATDPVYSDAEEEALDE